MARIFSKPDASSEDMVVVVSPLTVSTCGFRNLWSKQNNIVICFAPTSLARPH